MEYGKCIVTIDANKGEAFTSWLDNSEFKAINPKENPEEQHE